MTDDERKEYEWQLRATERAAYRRGQEDMRERAAKYVIERWATQTGVAIRALPILDEPAEEGE